jgi:hypothetical protein
MQIGTQYFRNSFIADFFRLSENETDLLVNSADQRLKIRLMMLEVWSQLFMEALPVAQVRDRLRRHTSFGAAS